MSQDKAAKIITKEINVRGKWNKADSYLQKKNEIEKMIENKFLQLVYLQELARKVLKNRFISANESYINMDKYLGKNQ